MRKFALAMSICGAALLACPTAFANDGKQPADASLSVLLGELAALKARVAEVRSATTGAKERADIQKGEIEYLRGEIKRLTAAQVSAEERFVSYVAEMAEFKAKTAGTIEALDKVPLVGYTSESATVRELSTKVDSLTQENTDMKSQLAALTIAVAALQAAPAPAADLKVAPRPQVEAPVYTPPPPQAYVPPPAPVQQVYVPPAPQCIDIAINAPEQLRKVHLLVWGDGPAQDTCGLRYLGACPEDCTHPQWGTPARVYELGDNRMLSIPAKMLPLVQAAQLCAFGQGLGHITLGPSGWDSMRRGQTPPMLTFNIDGNYRGPRGPAPGYMRSAGNGGQHAPVQGGGFRLASVIPEVAAMQQQGSGPQMFHGNRGQMQQPRPQMQQRPMFARPMQRPYYQQQRPPAFMPMVRRMMQAAMPRHQQPRRCWQKTPMGPRLVPC